MTAHDNHGPTNSQRPPATPGGPAVAPSRKLSGLSPLGLLRAFRRRWLLATSLGVFVSAAAAAATWFGMPVKYTATTVLQISMKEPKVLGAGAANPLEFSNYRGSQATLLTSRSLLNAVLKKEGIARLETLPRHPEQQIDWLQRELKVDFKLGQEFLRISIVGDRPDELKKLLNAMTEVYLREVVYKERTQKNEHLAKLEKILADYDKKLRDKREMVRVLVINVGSGDPQVIAVMQRSVQEQLALTQRELLQRRSESRALNVELAAKEARLKGVATADVPEAQVDALVDRAASVAQLLAKKRELEKKIAAVERISRRGAEEPALAPYRTELTGLEADLKGEREKLRPEIKEQLRTQTVGELRTAVAGLQERRDLVRELEKSLEADVKHLQEQAFKKNVSQADIEGYRVEIAQMEKTAERLAAEVENLKLEVDAPRRVELVEEAYASQTTMERQRLKGTGAAALVGFLLAAGLVSWREYRFRRLDSVLEVAHDLGMAVVGTLPPTPAATRSLLPWRKPDTDAWQHTLTESIDATRTSLLHTAREKGVRAVLVTSALSGEGKTSLSCQLAASLARAGLKTLLIDGDLRRPAAHRVFDLPFEPGLTEVLRGEVAAGETIRPTRVANLWLMPAGEWDQEATQALARSRLPELLAALREHYEYIVIDSAPVLPVVDSLLLAQHVDGVVLSVLREVSQLPLVQTALERLGSVGVRLLGAIMNGAPAEVYSYRYGYRSARESGGAAAAESTTTE